MQHYALTIALSFRLFLLYGVQRCRFKLVQDSHIQFVRIAVRLLMPRSVLGHHLTDVQHAPAYSSPVI